MFPAISHSYPPPLRPADDSERVRVLREYEILDSRPEAFFDNITRLAGFVAECPRAAISLIDSERQWLKAKFGIDHTQCPRDLSFCGHSVYSKKPLIVEDTLEDPRFHRHPAVLDEKSVRFYAGIPLITPEGHALGSLCVVDLRPRRLDPDRLAHLQALADVTMSRIESQRTARRLADALTQVKEIRGLLPICCHCKGIRDDRGYWRSVERYMNDRADVDFTHTICPNCIAEHHPDYRTGELKPFLKNA